MGHFYGFTDQIWASFRCTGPFLSYFRIHWLFHPPREVHSMDYMRWNGENGHVFCKLWPHTYYIHFHDLDLPYPTLKTKLKKFEYLPQTSHDDDTR